MIAAHQNESTLVPETETAEEDAPLQDGLLLENEGGLHEKNPPWQLVERTIRELDTGEGNSFCVLSVPGNTYVQTLRGFNGFHVEWRNSLSIADYSHFRASYPGASKKEIELKKHDHVNSGEHRDLIQIDDVIDAFRAFYRGEGMPAFLEWRLTDI